MTKIKNILKSILNWTYEMIKIILFAVIIVPPFFITLALVLSPGLIIILIAQYWFDQPYNIFSTVFAFAISALCIKIFGWWPVKVLRVLQKVPIIKYYANFFENTFSNSSSHNYYDQY